MQPQRHSLLVLRHLGATHTPPAARHNIHTQAQRSHSRNRKPARHLTQWVGNLRRQQTQRPSSRKQHKPHDKGRHKLAKGNAGGFTPHTITTTGAAAGVTITASLTGNQAGLTFHDNGNGTATISGQPSATARTHLVKVSATSGAAHVTQKLAVGISA